MGQDIGFSLYEKKPFDEEGKWVSVKDIETPNVCGRTNSTNSWGLYFEFNADGSTTPVFQKTLNKKLLDSDDSYKNKLKLMSFKDFKENIMQAVENDLQEAQQDKFSYLTSIDGYEKDIKELRELQRNCTEDQSYAFDRWEQNIRDYKECIDNIREGYRTFNEEDYNYTHAIAVKELINEMEKYLEENKYYVVPYYSY